jgi:hypothetical protein
MSIQNRASYPCHIRQINLSHITHLKHNIQWSNNKLNKRITRDYTFASQENT